MSDEVLNETAKVSKEEGDAVFAEKPKQSKVVGLKPEEAFEIFGTDPEVLETGIGQIEIKPMSIGQIRKMLKDAKNLVPSIEAELATGELNLTALSRIDQDALMTVVSIATMQPVAKLDQLTPAEFVRVVTKVILVNLDFFVQTLPKLIGGVAFSLAKAMQRYGVGVEQSNNSSPTATS